MQIYTPQSNLPRQHPQFGSNCNSSAFVSVSALIKQWRQKHWAKVNGAWPTEGYRPNTAAPHHRTAGDQSLVWKDTGRGLLWRSCPLWGDRRDSFKRARWDSCNVGHSSVLTFRLSLQIGHDRFSVSVQRNIGSGMLPMIYRRTHAVYTGVWDVRCSIVWSGWREKSHRADLLQ